MNSMSQRLSEVAVRGSYSASPEALEALQRGDTSALIASHRDRFGGWRMEKDDDEDEDEDDEDEDSEDGDDEDDDEDSDDEDDDADEDGPEGKKSKKAAKKKAEKDDSPEGLKKKVAALEDEKNRLYRGRTRARQERDDALEELAKLKKDGVTDDSVKAENSTLTATVAKQTQELQDAHLKIAFLSDNTYEWQDPGLALRAADLSDVEIDDDGKVHGLVSALEVLATKSPYLLKQKETKKRVTPKPGPSGQRPAKKAAGKKQAAENSRIKEKYKIRT